MQQTEFLMDLSALGGQWVTLFVMFGMLAVGRTHTFWAIFIASIIVFAILIPIRLYFPRKRPQPRHGLGLYGRIDNSSFPSLHAMRAAALAAVLALDNPAPWFVVVLALSVLGVCLMRVFFRRHHPSDVTVGVLFGVLSGIIGAWLA
jgi:membrane-associated phospholipid phosphatase